VQDGTLSLGGGGTNTSAAYTIETGATLNFSGSAVFNLDSDSTISGTGTLLKDGPSLLMLSGRNPDFTGPTTVNGGTLEVYGSLPHSPIALNAGTTLGGSGTVDTVTSTAATISPAIMTALGNVTFDSNSTFVVELDGPNPDAGGYDQLSVTGTVDLAGSTLSPSLGFTSTFGQSFTIIHSTSPIVGQFKGLAEGAKFMIGVVPFTITYVGGSGDDVVLTQDDTRQATTTTTASSQNPSDIGQLVTFTATVAPTAEQAQRLATSPSRSMARPGRRCPSSPSAARIRPRLRSRP